MRAAPALTAVVVLASLALAGCVGTGFGTDPVASPSSEETTGSDGNTTDAPASGNGTATEASGNETTTSGTDGNLTVNVAHVEAEWGMHPPPVEMKYRSYVDVTAWVNGTLSANGTTDVIEMAGDFVIPYRCWSCESSQPEAASESAAYTAWVDSDGSFAAWLEVRFDADNVPPVAEPYCDHVNLRVWGVAVPEGDMAPYDDDEFGGEVCTQPYP